MFTNCENHNYLLSPITTKAVNTRHDLLLTESLVVFGDLKWKTSQPACRLTANYVSSFLDNIVVLDKHPALPKYDLIIKKTISQVCPGFHESPKAFEPMWLKCIRAIEQNITIPYHTLSNRLVEKF